MIRLASTCPEYCRIWAIRVPLLLIQWMPLEPTIQILMRALVFDGQSVSLAANHPEPELAPAEAIIRPAKVGLSSTDLQVARGLFVDYQGIFAFRTHRSIHSHDPQAASKLSRSVTLTVPSSLRS